MPGARLTVEQRRTIERGYRIGLSQEQIASIIGKHKSTVSRELARSFSAPGSRSLSGRRLGATVRATSGPMTPSGRTGTR
jgi:IS30 family transposase